MEVNTEGKGEKSKIKISEKVRRNHYIFNQVTYSTSKSECIYIYISLIYDKYI